MLNPKKIEEADSSYKKERDEFLKLQEEIIKDDIRNFIVWCVEMWESAKSWTEPLLDEYQEIYTKISKEEAEADRWITEEFVDFIYDCEIWLTPEQKKVFRDDLSKLIVKFHTIKNKDEFMDYLNTDFINKREDKITKIVWFRRNFTSFFEDE